MDYQSDRPIAYIFERGDEGIGKLEAEMKKCGPPPPLTKRPISTNNAEDIDDPPHIQLQASDLASWEIRRATIDQARGWKTRKSLRAIIAAKHEWKEFKEHDLVNFCEVAGIRPRAIHGIVIVKNVGESQKRKRNRKRNSSTRRN